MARRKEPGIAGASAANREIRGLRDLMLLKILEDGPQDYTDVESEYEMRTDEIVGQDTLRRNLNRMMRVRPTPLIRYATGQVPHEDLLKTKRWDLTPHGREVLEEWQRRLAPNQLP